MLNHPLMHRLFAHPVEGRFDVADFRSAVCAAGLIPRREAELWHALFWMVAQKPTANGMTPTGSARSGDDGSTLGAWNLIRRLSAPETEPAASPALAEEHNVQHPASSVNENVPGHNLRSLSTDRGTDDATDRWSRPSTCPFVGPEAQGPLAFGTAYNPPKIVT